jgi:hypothetical protein
MGGASKTPICSSFPHPSLQQAQGKQLACHGEPVEPSGALHLDIFEQPAKEPFSTDS